VVFHPKKGGEIPTTPFYSLYSRGNSCQLLIGKTVSTHNFLTKKQIKKAIGCPGYIIDYLNDCGRLPIVQASNGKGYPIKYDPKSIEIVKKHINQQHR